MTMRNYTADILFKKEQAAEQFYDGIHKQLGVSDPDLDKALRNMGAKLDPFSDAFSLDRMRRYRNVVNLHFYSGRAEYDVIIAAFFHCGAHLIKLRLEADECDGVELYAAGKRVKKAKEFSKEYDALVIPDAHIEFARQVLDGKYAKARALLPQIDPAKVPYDKPMLAALTEFEAGDIGVSLLVPGGIDKNLSISYSGLDDDDEDPIMVLTATNGNLPLLKTMFACGFDPYEVGMGTETVLHSVFSGSGPLARAAIEFVADQCKENLNPVTESGSPLWYAYEHRSNLGSAQCFKERGALIIAPDGFYDGLKRADRVRKAAKHNDMPALQAHFQAQDHEMALDAALHARALDVIRWLDARQAIDWFAIVPRDQYGKPFEHPTPRYEIPFMWSDGDNQDLDLIGYIVDATVHNAQARDRLAVYLAAYERAVPLLRKLHQHGATLGAAPIEHGEMDFPLHRAAAKERLENAAVLLELGTYVPTLYYDEPFGPAMIKMIDQDRPAWTRLFKQHGLL